MRKPRIVKFKEPPKPAKVRTINFHAPLETRKDLMRANHWPFGCGYSPNDYWTIPEHHRKYDFIKESNDIKKVRKIPPNDDERKAYELFNYGRVIPTEGRVHIYCSSETAKKIDAYFDMDKKTYFVESTHPDIDLISKTYRTVERAEEHFEKRIRQMRDRRTMLADSRRVASSPNGKKPKILSTQTYMCQQIDRKGSGIKLYNVVLEATYDLISSRALDPWMPKKEMHWVIARGIAESGITISISYIGNCIEKDGSMIIDKFRSGKEFTYPPLSR